MKRLHVLLATSLIAALPLLAEEDNDIPDFGTADMEKNPRAHSTGYGRAKIALKAAVGYGFRAGGVAYPGSANGSESQTIDANNRTIDRTDQYLNYGQGLKIAVAGDVLLMENVYGELECGFTGKMPRTRVKLDDAHNGEKWEEKYRQACFCVKVLAVPTFTVLDLLDTHIGFGVGLAWTTLKFSKSDEQEDGYVKTRPGLCFAGKLGVDYPLTDLLALTVDLSTELVSFTVKEWLAAGSNTPVVTERNRSSDSNNVARPVKAPGSNVALRVGIRYAIF
jgi:hypothetical protein